MSKMELLVNGLCIYLWNIAEYLAFFWCYVLYKKTRLFKFYPLSFKYSSKTAFVFLENTTQKMNFHIEDSFSKCVQIRNFLRICSHLLKKFLKENFIICVVIYWSASTSFTVNAPFYIFQRFTVYSSMLQNIRKHWE